MTLVHLNLTLKSLKVQLPYMILGYPRPGFAYGTYDDLIQWTDDVEIYMAYDGRYVYFETELVWKWPPYGTKGK